MALKPQGNYVQFLRGTPSAYQNLSEKNPDTLYFISEKGALTGDLYLGSKRITGGSSVSTFTTLGQLTDVLVNAAQDKDILVFENGKWVNKAPSQVAQMLVKEMKPATKTEDGNGGLVPTPKAGQQDMFLRGDGTWANVVGTLDEEQLQEIESLKSTITTLVGTDADKSIHQIAVEALAETLLSEDNKDSFESLQEIASWIQSHPKDAAELNNRITTLESYIYDEVSEESDEDGNPIVINEGLVTTVGKISNTLSSVNSSIVQIQEDIVEIQGDVAEIQGDITEIYESIRWQDMDPDDINL